MPDPPPQGGYGESWFVLDFEAAYAGESTQTSGGPSDHDFYQPVGIRIERTAPVSVRALRSVQTEFSIQITAIREVQFTSSIQTSSARHIEIQESLDILAPETYAMALADDEAVTAFLLAVRS